ncbi:MAG: RNA polymerase sigma factor [Candidatus Kapabacteria bacterium]|nr:RNA polymerase sigma factor [Candidatus Kapabacteria bacterium]
MAAKNKMFRFAKSILTRTEEAEDAVQEVFVKLWIKRDSLDGCKNPEAFAMAATRNHCIDRIRANKERFFESVDDENKYASNIDKDDPHRSLELKDTRQRVMKMIDAFPEIRRTVMHLRETEGLSVSEISEITGLTTGAVRTNLSRARTKLRDMLTKEDNYEHR